MRCHLPRSAASMQSVSGGWAYTFRAPPPPPGVGSRGGAAAGHCLTTTVATKATTAIKNIRSEEEEEVPAECPRALFKPPLPLPLPLGNTGAASAAATSSIGGTGPLMLLYADALNNKERTAPAGLSSTIDEFKVGVS